MIGPKADLFYGATKTTKTSNIGHAARYIWERYGKTTRLITSDPGGFEPIQSLVDAGIIEPWLIRMWPYGPETLDKACQGWWPTDTNVVGSKLVPWLSQPDRDKVGCLAIEGLTSGGDMMLEYLSDTGSSLSQDPNFKITIGTTTYYGGNQSYYGWVQRALGQYVFKSAMIPGLHKVIWTALEAKGEENGEPLYGPAIAGKKAIGKAGAWFGNCLHFEAIETILPPARTSTSQGQPDATAKQLSVATEIKMYLRPHADAKSKIMFHAGTRAPFQYAKEIPESMEPNVYELYKKLDTLKAKADADVAGLKARYGKPAEEVKVKVS